MNRILINSIWAHIIIINIFIFDTLPSEAKNDSRPNIIIFVTDDQSPLTIDAKDNIISPPAFGFNGEKKVYTPEMDALAKNGMIFTRAYTSSSVCSPSRYGTLTGRYAGRCLGTSYMKLHPKGTLTQTENNAELEKDLPNVATVLKANGYRTGFVGKSHLIDHHILNNIDIWEKHGLKTYAQDADPKDPEVNAKMKHNHQFWQKTIREYGFDFADAIYAANLREIFNDAMNVHNVEWTTEAALEFIETSQDKPFFLYYAPTVPHGPNPWIKKKGKYIYALDADIAITGEGYLPDKKYPFMPSRQEILKEVKEKGRPLAHAYVRWLDAAVGAMRKKLEETNQLENTLFILTSDHGSWRYAKTTMHEGGLRVPLAIHWPKGMKKSAIGSSYSGLVQNIDYAPTFFELAGIKPPTNMVLDGLSIASVIKGETTKPLRSHLFAETGFSRAIITDNWKYFAIRYSKELQDRINAKEVFKGFTGEIIPMPYLTRNEHLGHHSSSSNKNYFDPEQLYNLKDDPGETKNVYKENPEMLKEMRKLLGKELQTFPDRPFGEFTKSD